METIVSVEKAALRGDFKALSFNKEKMKLQHIQIAVFTVKCIPVGQAIRIGVLKEQFSTECNLMFLMLSMC